MKGLHIKKLAMVSLVFGCVMIFATTPTFAAFTGYLICSREVTYLSKLDASKYRSVTLDMKEHDPQELIGLEVCKVASFSANKSCMTFDGSQNSVTVTLDNASEPYTIAINKSVVDVGIISGTFTLNDRE
ncbi:hypothetical protein [Marininema halotolerans]|uniref:Uncharacterized protein n=1 Tax=Marininema halotolerans TaxID=1155944 RepID=A0A1I6U058_9BACL|nr:hypothetical protein [Marininema halotolerans]SFS94856.1 hypothetical protein SAMN05444972_11270 [Marininema halotolerans]